MNYCFVLSTIKRIESNQINSQLWDPALTLLSRGERRGEERREGRGERGEGRGERGEGRGERGEGRGERGEGRGERGEGRRERGEERGEGERGGSPAEQIISCYSKTQQIISCYSKTRYPTTFKLCDFSFYLLDIVQEPNSENCLDLILLHPLVIVRKLSL